MKNVSKKILCLIGFMIVTYSQPGMSLDEVIDDVQETNTASEVINDEPSVPVVSDF